MMRSIGAWSAFFQRGYPVGQSRLEGFIRNKAQAGVPSRFRPSSHEGRRSGYPQDLVSHYTRRASLEPLEGFFLEEIAHELQIFDGMSPAPQASVRGTSLF